MDYFKYVRRWLFTNQKMHSGMMYKTGPPRDRFSNLRCRKMHWQNEDNWHWSIIFTDACKCLKPKWIMAYVFGYIHLNVLNTLCTFIGSNNEPNGPNVL